MTPAELDDRIRGALNDVAIDAPVDEGLEGATARHRRHRFTRRATAVAAAVVATLLLAGVVVTNRGDGDRAQEVITTPDETVSTSTTVAPNTEFPPLVEVPVVVDTPAAEDPAIQLSPAGPYVDGQEITVTVPSRYAGDWLNEGTPRLCMVLNEFGGEVCDPTAFVPSYDRITTSPEGDIARYVLRRTVFSPNGWRDCNDDGVTCRLVVLRADGSYGASQRLVFAGPPVPPRATISLAPTPAGEGQTVTAQPVGVAPRDAGKDLANQFAEGSRADFPGFGVVVCAYLPHSTDCFRTDDTDIIDGRSPNEPFRFTAHREFFGYNGWRDCALVPCFVRITRPYDQWWEAAAAGPLSIDASVAAAPRPNLRINPGGPYVEGDEVTVHVENLPSYHVYSRAICRPDNKASCWYGGGSDLSAEDVQKRFTLFQPPIDCTRDPCVLAIVPAGEGLPLMLEAPIRFRE